MTPGGSVSAHAVRRAVEALNRGDLDTYAAAFWPDAQRVVPGVPDALDVTSSIEMLRGFAASFDNFRLDADLLLESDNYVIAQWRTTGVHTGEFAGLAPTHRRFEVVGCEIYEFRGGLVIRSWAYGDPAEMVTQLTAEDHSS